MDTYTPDRHEEARDTQQGERESPLPRRARRQFFTPRTAALGAVVTCAIGFYAGIRVEKSQLSSSNSTTSVGSGTASGARTGARAGGFAGLAGKGATGSGSGAGSGGAAGAGGFPSAGGGAGPAGGLGGAGGGGAGTFGTVSSVNGKTLYVTSASGNTVKVKLTSSTKITKNQSVGRKAIRPGDTIVVTGGQGSGGATTAASVSDSGNRSSGSGGSGGSRSGGSGSGGSGSGSGSAVGSLFSSGG